MKQFVDLESSKMLRRPSFPHAQGSFPNTERLPQVDNSIDAWVWWIRLVDVNGDGHLDIATNLGISGPHYSPYFLNDGTGHFVPLPDDLGVGPLETYALVELGGCRWVDIINGGKGPAITLARTVPLSASHRLYLTLGPNNQLSFHRRSRPQRPPRPARLSRTRHLEPLTPAHDPIAGTRDKPVDRSFEHDRVLAALIQEARQVRVRDHISVPADLVQDESTLNPLDVE